MPVKDFLGRELLGDDLVYYCITGGNSAMRIGKIESIEIVRLHPSSTTERAPISLLYKVKIKPISTDGLGTEGMRRVTIKSAWYSTHNPDDGYVPTIFRIARIGNMAELANPVTILDTSIVPNIPDPAPRGLSRGGADDCFGPALATLDELSEINALNRAASSAGNADRALQQAFTDHEHLLMDGGGELEELEAAYDAYDATNIGGSIFGPR
jgi:hypothetical protein